MSDLQQNIRRTDWLRDFLGLARKYFALDEPSLMELPGKVLNESDELCSLHLLESSQCDVDVIRAQIMMECYGKPFLIQDGGMRQLHFSLGMIQSAMRNDDPFALGVAYTRKMMAFLLFVPHAGVYIDGGAWWRLAGQVLLSSSALYPFVGD